MTCSRQAAYSITLRVLENVNFGQMIRNGLLHFCIFEINSIVLKSSMQIDDRNGHVCSKDHFFVFLENISTLF